MRKVVENLFNNKHKLNEKEDDYRKHLKEAIFIYGIIHCKEQTISLYLYWLSPNINIVVVHHRDNIHCRDLTFDSLFRFYKSQDEGNSARLNHITSNAVNQQHGRSLT